MDTFEPCSRTRDGRPVAVQVLIDVNLRVALTVLETSLRRQPAEWPFCTSASRIGIVLQNMAGHPEKGIDCLTLQYKVHCINMPQCASR